MPSARLYERRVVFRRPTAGVSSAVVDAAAVTADAAAVDADDAAAVDAPAGEDALGPTAGLVDHNRTDFDGLLLVEMTLTTLGPAVKQ